MSTSVARTAVIQETEDSLISEGQAIVSTETQIEIQEPSRPKRRRKSNSRKTKPEVTTRGVEELQEVVVGDDDGTAKPKKKRRRVKEEPVYIIPDVEKKVTTFKGRLGESNNFRLFHLPLSAGC
jgi:UV DNA damage endonuclease